VRPSLSRADNLLAASQVCSVTGLAVHNKAQRPGQGREDVGRKGPTEKWESRTRQCETKLTAATTENGRESPRAPCTAAKRLLLLPLHQGATRCHLSASFTPSVEAVKVGKVYRRVKPPKVYSNATDTSNAHPESFVPAQMRRPIKKGGKKKKGGNARLSLGAFTRHLSLPLSRPHLLMEVW
jgi:hypothetical protein